MAVTFDATAKGANSNSYATVAQADDYHARRLHKADWTGATTDTKEAALMWATQILEDGMDWVGAKRTTDQALRWPRSGVVTPDGDNIDDDTIPQFLINATAELARLLIAQDRAADPDTKGFRSITVGPISLDVDKADQIQMIPEGVFLLMHPYGRRTIQSGTAKVVRA